jgi:hypothetical protein
MARQTPAADAARILVQFSDFMESPEGDLEKVPSRTLPPLGSLPACWGWIEVHLAILMSRPLSSKRLHGQRS